MFYFDHITQQPDSEWRILNQEYCPAVKPKTNTDNRSVPVYCLNMSVLAYSLWKIEDTWGTFFCCCRVHRVQINIPVNYLSPCQRLYSLKVSERSIWLQSQHQLMSGQCGLIFFARSMFSGDFYFLFFPNLWRSLTDLNYYHSVDQFFFLCPNHCR